MERRQTVKKRAIKRTKKEEDDSGELTGMGLKSAEMDIGWSEWNVSTMQGVPVCGVAAPGAEECQYVEWRALAQK